MRKYPWRVGSGHNSLLFQSVQTELFFIGPMLSENVTEIFMTVSERAEVPIRFFHTTLGLILMRKFIVI